MAITDGLGGGSSGRFRQPVPWRTILATIGMVVATYLAWVVLRRLSHIIGLLIVAAFFATVLTPAVDFFVRRLGLPRSISTLVVFVLGLVGLAALLAAFINPIVREVNGFVDDFPQFVENAREGRGPIGRLVQRYDIDTYIEENQEQWQRSLRNAGAPALDIVRSVASGVFAFVTILVLTFLMVLEGPRITQTGMKVLADRHRERVRVVAADCAKAVTGYMAGNLLISVVAGLSTFVFLTIVGVPFAGVLGLWVAFADLIPLVGATLGAIPTVGVAFLSSPGRGIAALLFYVVYQQIENHLLQPTIMSRTVDLNPLAVLVSVLVGVELFGILGALLAIPVAGILQVVVRNIYDERQGEFKDTPSVGAAEVPADLAHDEVEGEVEVEGEGTKEPA
jgi:predicted PurR-regulated permease PerM